MSKRVLNKLTPRQVQAWKGPGLLGDGGGLYVDADGEARKRWVFQFTSPTTGKVRHLGLGAAYDRSPVFVSLAEAREAAAAARRAVRDGVDPIDARREAKDARRLSERENERRAAVPTFGDYSAKFIALHRDGWSNAEHARQWRQSLKTHAAALNGMKVDEIDVEAVLSVLRPKWLELPETMLRVRARIAQILDAATAEGLRTGDNPAKGNFGTLLPRHAKGTRTHQRAMPYGDVPALAKALKAEDSIAARALEFVLLTATRTNEAIGMKWDEIDGDMWTIPAERMKKRVAHAVPLSPRAMEILQEMRALRDPEKPNPFVFPGVRSRRINDNALLECLKRVEFHAKTSVHGLRSTFRDWCAEQTSFPHAVCEKALAHGIAADKTEAAYLRTNLYEQRKPLMNVWARFCADTSNVVRISEAAA